jgi:hypothetical protein
MGAQGFFSKLTIEIDGSRLTLMGGRYTLWLRTKMGPENHGWYPK